MKARIDLLTVWDSTLTFSWIVLYKRQNQKLEDFPNLKRWFETTQARPTTIRAYDKAEVFKAEQISIEQS